MGGTPPSGDGTGVKRGENQRLVSLNFSAIIIRIGFLNNFSKIDFFPPKIVLHDNVLIFLN